MQIIDFQAARTRVLKHEQKMLLKIAAQISWYVDVEFTNAELVPPANKPTIADLLREGVAVLGFEATVQEIEL